MNSLEIPPLTVQRGLCKKTDCSWSWFIQHCQSERITGFCSFLDIRTLNLMCASGLMADIPFNLYPLCTLYLGQVYCNPPAMAFYILVNIYTHSIEQSPWVANRFSAGQEIHCILWILKVHYHIDKSPPPFPILSQINSLHSLPSHFLKIRLNIIFPCTKSHVHFPLFSLYQRSSPSPRKMIQFVTRPVSTGSC